MSRSIRKAVAFITFLALSLQIFVVSDVAAVKAEETSTTFDVSEWGVIGIINPTESVTIPHDFDVDDISLGIGELGIKSLTIEKGYESVSIYGGSDVEKLILPEGINYLYIGDFTSLKELVIPNGTSNVSIYNIGVEKINVPASVNSFEIAWSNNLKSINLKEGLQEYSQWGCPELKNVKIPASVYYMSSDDYSNMTVSSDNIHYEIYEGSLYYDKSLISAADRKVLNIKDGTESIGQWALCNDFAVTTINIPDSVKMLDYGAFAGAVNVKKLILPKGLICIYSYAFDSVGASSIEIPSSVEYVDDNAFSGYKGVINLENNYSKVLESYNGAIYSKDYASLLSYPKTKNTLSLHKDCITISYDALNGCQFTDLEIPDGVTYYSYNLSDCNKLKSISLPSSVIWVDSYSLTFNTPVTVTRYIVDSDNPYLSSNDGCIYSRDKEVLYAVPFTTNKLKVIRGCVTIDYAALGLYEYYDYEKDEYIPRNLEVELPATVSFIGYNSLEAISYAKMESGTTPAKVISDYNSYSWRTISYEFTDSSKEILSKIAVGNEISIKKGKTTNVNYTIPSGLIIVDKLTPAYENSNIYAKASFTSSNKKIAKVNKKSGKITAVKKGKTTIKAKFEMPDGTKKTYKIKVTVK